MIQNLVMDPEVTVGSRHLLMIDVARAHTPARRGEHRAAHRERLGERLPGIGRELAGNEPVN